MAYDVAKQYRCDIVRSRAKIHIDDLLMTYARIIDDICPCTERDFIQSFNQELKIYLLSLGMGIDTKALNNHRTETASTLFGMYYVDRTKTVHVSERTEKLLKDGDQPAFFKDFCYKLQFPNGMTKNNTLQKRIDDRIKVYPCRILLKVLEKAQHAGMVLNIREVGYYILNSLDVLSGNATSSEIITQIKKDRKLKIKCNIDTKRNRPWDWEHIEGIINYLELANLITVVGKKSHGHEREVILNTAEIRAIHVFVKNCNKSLGFDVFRYNRDTVDLRKEFKYAWDFYNASLSDKNEYFATSLDALGITTLPSGTAVSDGDYKIIMGKIGESYIFDYEVARVSKINPLIYAF